MRVKKAGKNLSTELVGSTMSTPAITITKSAPISEAAAIMLAKTIRRLPVVDADNYPIGCVAVSRQRQCCATVGQAQGARRCYAPAALLLMVGRACRL